MIRYNASSIEYKNVIKHASNHTAVLAEVEWRTKMITENAHIKVEQFNRLGLHYNLVAKANSKRRFHAMYDKIHRIDILTEAWKRVKANGGAGGIDHISINDVKAYGEEKLIAEITDTQFLTGCLKTFMTSSLSRAPCNV